MKVFYETSLTLHSQPEPGAKSGRLKKKSLVNYKDLKKKHDCEFLPSTKAPAQLVTLDLLGNLDLAVNGHLVSGV